MVGTSKVEPSDFKEGESKRQASSILMRNVSTSHTTARQSLQSKKVRLKTNDVDIWMRQSVGSSEQKWLRFDFDSSCTCTSATYRERS